MKKNIRHSIPDAFGNIRYSKIGFTIIELLVSVFIIATITGIFLANYHSANKRQKLIMAAQKLASDIRLAQSYALGAKEFAGAVPFGGWGARFALNANNYIIFADVDGDFNYDNGEEYNTVNLPNGITISAVIGAGDPVNIVFVAPDPITYINNDFATNARIELTDGDTVKTVEVNFLGLVDVVD